MEQRPILPPGQPDLSETELRRRLKRQGPPGRRTSPKSPQELGGPSAEASQWPRGDHDLNPDFYDPDLRLTPAAVLVPIVLRQASPTLLLTRRTDHLHDHAGQVSFPGGRVDPGDADAAAAALRETEEEVGLPRARVALIGTLDTYVTRTGFEVTPLVGLVTPPFPVKPDPFEVAEVFEVPLGHFLDPGNKETRSRVYEGKERHFYAYRTASHLVWGATAGMIVNLAEVLTK